MEITMKNAGASRIGMSLKSQRFEEEMRLFLQKRLRILTSTVSILLVFLSVIFIMSLASEPARNLWQAILHFCTRFPNTMGEFLKAHIRSNPIPPSKRQPGIPDDLENLLLQGLEKIPSQRPESAKALQDALMSCRDSGQWDSKDADNWWAEYGESLAQPQSPQGDTLTQLIQNGTDVTLTIQDIKGS
jgi:serine/threonine protein kinase